jgi:hypothetical protein
MRRWLPLVVCAWMSAASSAEPPDLSGWWVLGRGDAPPLVQLLQKPPVLRPVKQDELLRSLAALLRGEIALDYCRPNEVGGFLNGTGFEDALEFLSTAGRLTLAGHTGLLRRIYLDGQMPRGGPVDSPSGFSTGRWNPDGTLVIETRFLSPTNRYPVPIAGAPRLGDGARLVERVRLVDSDTLEIRYTLHAPELADMPLVNTAVYRRDHGHVGQFVDFCPLDDRLLDRASGSTTFDTHPPPDLPPPP